MPRVENRPGGETVVRGMEATGRMAKLIAGEISVRDLDDEELARGQFRNADGTFGGRPSVVIPREMLQEMVRRLLERGDELWRTGFNMAIATHLEICSDLNVDPRTRLAAAQYIIERVSGKTPDRVLVTADDAIESLFRQLLTRDDGLEEPVHEAEIVEETPVMSFT